MNLIDFLTSPAADALGWTLFHALWQGFAIVLPTAVVLHLLRHRSSALRYQVGVLALPGQLLASMATFWVYYQPKVLVSLSSTYAATVMRPLPVSWQVLTQTLPWHQQVQQFMESHLSQFVFVYLIGIAIFGLRLAGGWLYLQRLSHAAVEPASNTLINLTGKLRVALSLQMVVQVRESARIAVPMVVGTLKPVLLLPISLVTNLSMREIEAVLAHELAHVKRHDYAVNLLQSVMEVLYFFHPALWWLSARIREEREHCCDDLAMQACGGNGRALAQALARVEELRNIDNRSTPALAMALSSGRQLLLHRVRRMLGVATRPVVSNGSLAGLTLATLLLVSASVYAIQREQPTPKPRTSQSQSTRRHKVDSRSEYGMVNNEKIGYVVWKGQKLPPTRVARLQRELNQVMAGQLSLDDVKQPDRDILLTIIEKNNSFDEGMKTLSNGSAHIDYDNIAASALNNVSISLDDTAEKVEAVSHEDPMKEGPTSISEAMQNGDTSRLGAAQQQLEILTRKMQEVMTERQPIIDRLSKEITELTGRNSDWKKMTDQFVRQQSVLAKQQNTLAKQQSALAQQLAPLHVEIARLSLQKSTKADQLIKQKQLQSDLIEKKMDQLGSKMGELGSQMQPLDAKLEINQQRLSILADSISKLVEPASELSEKIGELSNQIAEEANEQAEKAMQQAETAMRLVENINVNVPVSSIRPARVPIPPKVLRGTLTPARAPRPPKSLRGVIAPAVPILPAAPYKVVEGEVIPATPAIPPRPNARVSVPQPAPKPAIAPVPTPVAVPEPPK